MVDLVDGLFANERRLGKSDRLRCAVRGTQKIGTDERQSTHAGTIASCSLAWNVERCGLYSGTRNGQNDQGDLGATARRRQTGGFQIELRSEEHHDDLFRG